MSDSATPPTAIDPTAIRASARRILEQNTKQGVSTWDGRPYHYACPSLTIYPFQWFWDSCFHAIAFSHWDAQRGADELRTLLSGARADGFIPHMIFWEREQYESVVEDKHKFALDTPYSTRTIQPPVLAQAVDRVVQAGAGQAFLDEVLPRVRAFYDWLAANRDPDGDGLIAIIQPDESGMDAAPQFDVMLSHLPLDHPKVAEVLMRIAPTHGEQLWQLAGHLMNHDIKALMAGLAALAHDFPELPQWVAEAVADWLLGSYRAVDYNLPEVFALDLFVCEDVLVNAIYAQGLQTLARLLPAGEGEVYRQRARRVTEALVAKCWDPERGAFFDLMGQAENPAPVLTISSLMPLILDDLDPAIAERLVREQVRNPETFALRYPLPSVAESEPTFVPSLEWGLIWRGPTWINTNWFLARALAERGYREEARAIARASCELVQRSGYWECFNPLTAEGHGAPNFGWSTLVVDLLDLV